MVYRGKKMFRVHGNRFSGQTLKIYEKCNMDKLRILGGQIANRLQWQWIFKKSLLVLREYMSKWPLIIKVLPFSWNPRLFSLMSFVQLINCSALQLLFNRNSSLFKMGPYLQNGIANFRRVVIGWPYKCYLSQTFFCFLTSVDFEDKLLVISPFTAGK